MSRDRYELIDFGAGQKLESLAGYRIVRPSPAAVDVAPHDKESWQDVDAAFDASTKRWHHHRPWPENLTLDCGGFRMPVRPTPFGHIGLFPEQSPHWRWLMSEPVPAGESREALNLFAYTGASTMALVAAGYRVAHVDAAKPNVQAARLAAQANGWPEAPIRYLVDDAAKFAARELRRRRRYHTLVLDPPGYGHSPKGTTWRLERDLWPLLECSLQLVDPASFRLLITGHSPQVDARRVLEFLRETPRLPRSVRQSGLRTSSGRSQLKDAASRSLDAGFFVRVSTS